MIIQLSKYAFIVSISAHLAAFSLFSLSSGPRVFKNESRVNFWGQLLSMREASHSLGPATAPAAAILSADKGFIPRQNILTNSYPFLNPDKLSLKPAADLNPSFLNKTGYYPVFEGNGFEPLRTEEKGVIFYPSLPSNFALYFRDRQSAHVELSFSFEKNSSAYQLLIKRKISSGNLEADLLISRYIKRYLYMQEGLALNEGWQTVKVELSVKR